MKQQILIARSAWVAVILFTFLCGVPPRRGYPLTLAPTSAAAPSIDVLKLQDKGLWTRVNAMPYHQSGAVVWLCRSPLPGEVSPHANTNIVVYVNPVGRKSMFSNSPHFPQGTVIVKEKVDGNSRVSPPPVLLYTVMTKRIAGYNPQVGDWEFSVISGDGKRLDATGRLENCQTCHIPQAKDDFVFRPYLAAQTK